jgi:alkenylglycerophosphocholine/alkenylglycerophosphoethanolamine hydrolase
MTISAKARGLAFVAVLAAAGYLVGLGRDWPVLRLAAKPIPVACLLAWVLAADPDRYGRLVAAGLALSMAGDVLLEFPSLFLAGLGAFLCAHISYIMAFLTDTRRPALAWTLPFAVWLGVVYATIRSGLDGMTGPVSLYVLAIGVMMWRAAALVGGTGSPRPAGMAGLAGAILFGLSDTLIGLDRFRMPIPGVRYPIILLFWAGQLGLALSCQRRPRAEPVSE